MKRPRLKLARANRKENPDAVMSVGDHLRELRDRLIVSAIAVVIGSVVGWFLFDHLFALVTYPIEKANADGANLSANFATILSSFDLRMRLSIWAGVLITSPVWVYQFFAYVGPGMTRKEKGYTAVFGVVGVLLFCSGSALGIWIMPHAVQILTSFIPRLASTSGIIDVSVYLSFYLRLVLVFGVAFLLPEFLVALNRLGLMKGRTMLKGWRWAVVGIFVFMAFANPLPDPWSMVFMSAPIAGLYFLACGISIHHDKVVARRRAKEDAELDAALAAPAGKSQPASVSQALPASEPTAQLTSGSRASGAQLPAADADGQVLLEAAPTEAATVPASDEQAG